MRFTGDWMMYCTVLYLCGWHLMREDICHEIFFFSRLQMIEMRRGDVAVGAEVT